MQTNGVLANVTVDFITTVSTHKLSFRGLIPSPLVKSVWL